MFLAILGLFIVYLIPLIAVRRLKEMVTESRKQTELLRTLVEGKKTPPVNWVKSD